MKVSKGECAHCGEDKKLPWAAMYGDDQSDEGSGGGLCKKCGKKEVRAFFSNAMSRPTRKKEIKRARKKLKKLPRGRTIRLWS